MEVADAAHQRGCLSKAPDVIRTCVDSIRRMGHAIERVRGGYARGKYQTRGEFPSEGSFLGGEQIIRLVTADDVSIFVSSACRQTARLYAFVGGRR